MDFEEHEARIFAGLGVTEYETLPGDPVWCDDTYPMSKAEVIALYRLHNLIDAVRNDAAVKKGGR